MGNRPKKGDETRAFAWRVTQQLDGQVEVEFGDVWSASADSQEDGNRVVFQLLGQRLLEIARKCMRARMEPEGPLAEKSAACVDCGAPLEPLETYQAVNALDPAGPVVGPLCEADFRKRAPEKDG